MKICIMLLRRRMLESPSGHSTMTPLRQAIYGKSDLGEEQIR